MINIRVLVETNLSPDILDSRLGFHGWGGSLMAVHIYIFLAATSLLIFRTLKASLYK